MFDIEQPHIANRSSSIVTSRYDIDVRAHLIVSFLMIIAIVLITRVTVALSVAAFVLFFALCVVPSRRSFARGLVFPAFTGLVLLLFQTYTYGTTAVCVILFPVFAEGFMSGVLIFSRILASVSILLILIQVVPPLQLIQSLGWFKVPSEIRQMMLLMLSYVNLLIRETTSMFRAQKARLGYSSKLGLLARLKNVSIVAGMIIVRAYDRSHRIFLSMKARGYQSEYSVEGNVGRFKVTDYVFVLFAIMLVTGIVLVGAV